jgi:hypothetical protein
MAKAKPRSWPSFLPFIMLSSVHGGLNHEAMSQTGHHPEEESGCARAIRKNKF